MRLHIYYSNRIVASDIKKYLVSIKQSKISEVLLSKKYVLIYLIIIYLSSLFVINLVFLQQQSTNSRSSIKRFLQSGKYYSGENVSY